MNNPVQTKCSAGLFRYHAYGVRLITYYPRSARGEKLYYLIVFFAKKWSQKTEYHKLNRICNAENVTEHSYHPALKTLKVLKL